MRVIVATTSVPFLRGGAEYLTDSLCDALAAGGHTVERFDLPFWSDYRQMPEQMMALRLLDLSGHGDRLIAIRTPGYLVRHHNKVVWFIHHHRPSFDLWGTPYQDVPSNDLGTGYREGFRSADNLALREASAVFVNSRRMADRVRQYNGIDSEVLYPPLRRGHGLFPGSTGDYILCPGRIVRHKRQHLCVEAMRFVTAPVRLVIAGPSDSPEYVDELERIAADSGVADRVSVFARWIDESEKSELYAQSLAVAYAPHDEDSYGYVTLEAAQSRKAVVTCTDSGGLLEFVEHGVSGFIASPDPVELAACFDSLWDRTVARRMGRASFDRVSELNITWDHVLGRLLS
jgi:glycosyltransferase involved in cell wall biosynthesis